MEGDGSELSKVVESLYDAALDSALWSAVPLNLAKALSASSAVIKLQGFGGVDLVATTENFEGEGRDPALADHWHRNDLWVQRSAAQGFDSVVVGHELTPFQELEETGFYRDWLRRLAIRDMVGGVVRSADAIGVLGVHRGPREAAFGEMDRAAIQVLLPHLKRAFRIRERLADIADHATHDALEASPLGLIIVEGPQRRVRNFNRAAERLLREAGAIALRSGRLVAGDPFADTRLEAMISAALTNATGGRVSPPPMIALRRSDGSALIVGAAPMTARHLRIGIPAVLVTVREVLPPRLDLDLVREVFGLTRAEALVCGALCRGLTMADVSAELGIGISTVRSHLKSAMVKTNTRRQASLVSLLLSLPHTAT